jgi:hypothetical protein
MRALTHIEEDDAGEAWCAPYGREKHRRSLFRASAASFGPVDTPYTIPYYAHGAEYRQPAKIALSPFLLESPGGFKQYR